MEPYPFEDPVASTSRAIFVLPHQPPADEDEDSRNDPMWRLRTRIYDEAWGKCSARIDETISSLHDASLDQIVQFVDDSRGTSDSLLSTLTGRPPIRTGLIIGASPGSSPLLYSALSRSLEEDTPESKTCLMSRFAGRDCANIKAAMRSLIAGFVGSVAGDDEEEQRSSSTLKAADALAPEDPQNLVAWYSHQFPDRATGPTLVVLLEDLEAMDGRVLTQIIQTLSRHVQALPIVLLVGIATSAKALHDAVPRRVTNLLETTSFFVEPGVGAFTALMRGLFVEWEAPLGLAPALYAYLWKTFGQMHHSIDATISSLQYLYINHFIIQPHGLLSSPLSPSDRALLDSDPQFWSSLASKPYATAFHKSSSEEQDIPDNIFAELERCRDERSAWQMRLKGGWKTLEVMEAFWEKRVSPEKALSLLAEGKLEVHGRDLCGMVLHSSSSRMEKFLETIVIQLSQMYLHDSNLSTTLLYSLEDDITSLKAILALPRPAGRLNLINDNVVGSDLIHGSTISKVDRQFSALARKVSTSIQQEFKESFVLPTSLPLHELSFATEVSPLRQFHPSFLPVFDKALKPSHNALSTDVEEDVKVAYRLYQDTGKQINLGDWWEAFDQAALDEPHAEVEGEDVVMEEGVETGGKKRARSGEGDEDESEEEEEEEREGTERERRKQARFLQTIGDLAYVGYLQPTSRKAEHVLKSVF